MAMVQRPAKPAKYPWIIPHLTVHDCEAAMDFYEKAFGFRPSEEEPLKSPDGHILHAEMWYRDGAIMFGREGAFGCETKSPASSGIQLPISLYLYCENVDELARQAIAAGANVVFEPTNMFWGDRMTTLTDLDGYTWSFATNVADFDPSKMPAMAAT